MYAAVTFAVFLSLTSLFGRGSREVRIECDHTGIVAYRIEAKEGTMVEYAGARHRVDGTGVIELVVDPAATRIRVGTETFPLPLFGRADSFGVVTLKSGARSTERGAR